MTAVASRSRPGVVYDVTDAGCTCPRYRYSRPHICAHYSEFHREVPMPSNGTGTTAITTVQDRAAQYAVLAEVITKGNLRSLSDKERVEYYKAVCESVGLNPLTKPFDYLDLSGKLVLYATKTCTDQLRDLHGVSIYKIEPAFADDLCTFTVYVRDKAGREDVDIGVTPLAGLRGEARANATMKALTKAKRRATLSVCGLGWLDETEIETIPDARRVEVDEAGAIAEMAAIAEPPRRPEPEPEPAQPKRKAYKDAAGNIIDPDKRLPASHAWWKRYQALWAKAQDLGLQPTTQRADITARELLDAIEALRDRIADYEERIPAAAAEPVEGDLASAGAPE